VAADLFSAKPIAALWDWIGLRAIGPAGPPLLAAPPKQSAGPKPRALPVGSVVTMAPADCVRAWAAGLPSCMGSRLAIALRCWLPPDVARSGPERAYGTFRAANSANPFIESAGPIGEMSRRGARSLRWQCNGY
jgi:hypothetical protein